MNHSTISNSNSESNATNGSIISTGEVFPDGALIEFVVGPSGLNRADLLLWNGKKAVAGPRVEHHGCIYEAPELPASLCRAMRLPSQPIDYGSARHVFAEISDLFKRHSDLPERESSLLACFVISTWLADRFPTAPSVIISAAEQELGVDVLRLLSCVCRRALMFAELTPVGFRSLPMVLSPTLLLVQQQLFARPAHTRLRRSLMIPILAYHTQEQAYGGLKPSARKRLQKLVAELEQDQKTPSLFPRLKSGTKLLRQWQGEMHEVLVVDDGFEYRGQWYESLSEIARQISGTRWSGPLFFGLKPTRKTGSAQ